MIVYFSSGTLNTHRFVERLNLPSTRIPIDHRQPVRDITEPYVLIVPTYARGDGTGSVVKPVIKFLNQHRHLMLGVISSGNRNFGEYYGYAADVISAKCGVPVLYKFELMGSDQDVQTVRNGVIRMIKESNTEK